MAVPIAAPTVRKLMGPAPRISMTFSTKFRIATSAIRVGMESAHRWLPKRAAEHEEHQQPNALDRNIVCRVWKRLGANRRRRLDEIQQRRRQHVAEGREDTDPQCHGRQERLIHGAIDLVVVARPSLTRTSMPIPRSASRRR